MVEILKNMEHVRGTWKPVADVSRHIFKASVTCPGCGQTMTLRSHTIAADGTVSPSLVCPFDGCEFHEFVRLADWDGGAV